MELTEAEAECLKLMTDKKTDRYYTCLSAQYLKTALHLNTTGQLNKITQGLLDKGYLEQCNQYVADGIKAKLRSKSINNRIAEFKPESTVYVLCKIKEKCKKLM